MNGRDTKHEMTRMHANDARNVSTTQGNNDTNVSSGDDKIPVVAILRETVNVWERRAPLAPCHVHDLVKNGVKVIVQPCERRAYRMQEYTGAGAVIQEDISQATLVLGVKQVAIEGLVAEKTYAFFSHTIKGQDENMPLLDAILDKKIRLMDYELIADKESGKRAQVFGRFAGMAGMMNILNGLGLRFLTLGYGTPFIHIAPPVVYRAVEQAKQAMRDAGNDIIKGCLPGDVTPLIFVFTGSGNVSQGAQEIFRELPHEFVTVDDLPTVVMEGDANKVYGCVASREHLYARADGGPFSLKEFQERPERYVSQFATKIAPYATCIINGIFWTDRCPRLITAKDAVMLVTQTNSATCRASQTGLSLPLPCRPLAICDISADINGSVEFTRKCTSIGAPFCVYDPVTDTTSPGVEGRGILVCSIDNMPTQFPREATSCFGSQLRPFLQDMMRSDAATSFEDFACDPALKDAVIASNGTLTPKYKCIADLRRSRSSTE